MKLMAVRRYGRAELIASGCESGYLKRLLTIEVAAHSADLPVLGQDQVEPVVRRDRRPARAGALRQRNHEVLIPRRDELLDLELHRDDAHAALPVAQELGSGCGSEMCVRPR